MRPRTGLKGILLSQDKGSVEFKSRSVEYEGEVMSIAEKKPVSITLNTSVKRAAQVMCRNNLRRLPVVDTQKSVRGVIRSSDLINFLGGGEKYKIIEDRFNGNFLAAINIPVRDIMKTELPILDDTASIKEVFNAFNKYGIGGFPIVKKGKLVAIITEKDFVHLLSHCLKGKVRDYVSEEVISLPPKTAISDAAKVMIRNSYRRIPVEQYDRIIGIITATDIVRALGEWLFKKDAQASDVLRTPIDKIMTKDVVTVSLNDNIKKVIRIMLEKSIGGFPIVDKNIIKGMITEKDLLKKVVI